MTTVMQQAWDGVTVEHYAKKRSAHPELWRYVHRLIEAYHINSVLEVGGGIPHLSPFVRDYTGVEANATICDEARDMYPRATMIHADWLSMDMDSIRGLGAFDMSIAANVIEYVDSPYEFLWRLFHSGSKLVVCSFYSGTNRRRNKWRVLRRAMNASTSRLARSHRHHGNRYCVQSLHRWLRMIGCRRDQYDVFQLGTARVKNRLFREGIVVIYKHVIQPT